MLPAVSQVSYWAAKQMHDGCQTKHGDLVIMTRWDVDIATDEQMQAEIREWMTPRAFQI